MSGSNKAVWAVVGAIVAISTIAGAGGMAMSLYANHRQNAQPPEQAEIVQTPQSTLSRLATGAMERLETPQNLQPAPEYVFRDRTGTAVRFSTFRGKVVLVNLWAMWCAPCRNEMPTLAALARDYQDNENLIVLPVNVDASAEGVARARTFISQHAPLPFYNDVKFQLPFELPGKGVMPQTVLLDRLGRIRASFSGEADWNSPEARAVIDAVLAEDAGAPSA